MENKPIIAYHVNIIAEKENPDEASSNSLAGFKIFATRPIMATKLGWHQTKITQRGKELSEKMSGTANIIKTSISEYCTGLTDQDVEDLTNITINPKLKENHLEFIKKIKMNGYKTICITDHDTIHHSIFKTKIAKNQNLNFEDIYDGVITVPYQSNPLQNSNFRKHDEKWYIAKEKCHHSHCQALRSLADELNPQAPIIIVDEQKKNLDQIHQNTNIIDIIAFETIEQTQQALQQKGVLLK